MNGNGRNPSALSTASHSTPGQHIGQQDYKARLSAYTSKMADDDTGRGGLRKGSTADESIEGSDTDDLVQLLAVQSYHLPGNNWLQDWWQFMFNNHPVFGICCHNAVHPIKSFTRVVALVGTVTFGLAITSIFYVFFLWNPKFDRVLATITTDSGNQFVLTTGMLLLWTIGGGIHCVFNLVMWRIAACACCQSGGCCESYACCPSLGKHMIRFFVFCIVGFCVLVIILRVAINDREKKESNADFDESNQGFNTMLDDQTDFSVENVSDFSFVLNYLVEMTISFFIYYPIGGTMLFSGFFSCGYKIPILGGRPYEIECEERQNSRRQRGGSTQRGSINV